MKLISLLTILVCFINVLHAQDLPVKMAMLFKNNRALIFKEGVVKTLDGIYSTRNLPEALTDTYWVSTSNNRIESVYVVQDSIEEMNKLESLLRILMNNVGKTVRLTTNTNNKTQALEGRIDRVLVNDLILLEGNKWTVINEKEIVQLEFVDKPDRMIGAKIPERRLDVRFSDKQSTQELALSYLRENIGWLPVYRLELIEKNKGRLALRAELINNGESLETAELRLAVSEPSFVKAEGLSPFFVFKRVNYGYLDSLQDFSGFRMGSYVVNLSARNYSWSSGDDENYIQNINFQGSQLEDIYYYSVRPGNFPKGSRYQYPIFEEEVQLEHFYECTIEDRYAFDFEEDNEKKVPVIRDIFPVYHFVEFDNKTKYPWTEGLVNIFSKPITKTVPKITSKSKIDTSLLVKYRADLEPVSQDKLNYTSLSSKCKVRIGNAPDVMVAHIEGNVNRVLKANKILNEQYDLLTVEAQASLINRSNETIKLKLRRNIIGTPLNTQHKWQIIEEKASLLVNPTVKLLWDIELMPGEEKKWTYTYQTYVKSSSK